MRKLLAGRAVCQVSTTVLYSYPKRVIRLRFAAGLAAAALLVVAAGCGQGDSKLIVGATTSLDDSGILQELIDEFKERSGYDVTPVVAGSGQILELGRRGEVDVTFTHSPPDESSFLAEGFGIDPRRVMENRFLIVGPDDDPALVAGASDSIQAFQRIAAAEAPFISRGDESGTNRREMAIWDDAGIDPSGEGWYQESAVGQGENLLVASNKQAYLLVDSATYTALKDVVELTSFVVDDVVNRYTVALVNPNLHDEVNAEVATAFIDFLASEPAEAIINSFGREEFGVQLFYLPGALDEPPAFPFPLQ